MAGSTTATLPRTRRFTVSEYHRMAEAGVLGEDQVHVYRQPGADRYTDHDVLDA